MKNLAAYLEKNLQGLTVSFNVCYNGSYDTIAVSNSQNDDIVFIGTGGKSFIQIGIEEDTFDLASKEGVLAWFIERHNLAVNTLIPEDEEHALMYTALLADGYKRFSDSDWDGYSGAESFDNGALPLIKEVDFDDSVCFTYIYDLSGMTVNKYDDLSEEAELEFASITY